MLDRLPWDGMAEARVLLIRHGESVWNATGRWQGWGDPPLSQRGEAQAASLAARLVGAGITRIVSSDLERAHATAAIVGRVLGLEHERDPRLRERDLGAWSGLTAVEIAARFPEDLARFRAREADLRPGGGESRIAFFARVSPALRALAETTSVGSLAIVTHLGVIRLVAPELRPENAEVVAIEAARLVGT
jgi:broad specificity phosphatase PhoE